MPKVTQRCLLFTLKLSTWGSFHAPSPQTILNTNNSYSLSVLTNAPPLPHLV